MRGLFLVFVVLLAALPARANVDVFEKRLASLEEALGPITAKAEEMAHLHKIAQETNSIAVKDLQLQIKELVLSMRELETEVKNLKSAFAAAPASAPAPAPSSEAKKDSAKPTQEIDAESAVFLEATKKFNDGDYQGAIVKFIENMKAYPEGPRFHDNMFYMALAMSALGKKADACNTLKVLLEAGSSLERGLKGRVEAEAERLKCNG